MNPVRDSGAVGDEHPAAAKLIVNKRTRRIVTFHLASFD
jgi:hypothetical protein